MYGTGVRLSMGELRLYLPYAKKKGPSCDGPQVLSSRLRIQPCYRFIRRRNIAIMGRIARPMRPSEVGSGTDKKLI